MITAKLKCQMPWCGQKPWEQELVPVHGPEPVGKRYWLKISIPSTPPPAGAYFGWDWLLSVWHQPTQPCADYTFLEPPHCPTCRHIGDTR